MLRSWACISALAAGVLCADVSQPPELARVQEEITRLRLLVDAGAAPRVQLERAEAALADAGDAAFLRKTLYGGELTETQAEEMIRAAERRLERRKQSLAAAQRLVQEGVASQLSVTSHLEDLDRAREEFDLAHSRARLTQEIAEMARLEEESERTPPPADSGVPRPMERFDGEAAFSTDDLRLVLLAFENRFGKSLPISALGETAVHRAMGFDHRNRVDVAVHPDQPEGVWLRDYLLARRIPFYAFRRAIPGKATGSHIHIGPSSTRIVRGG